MARTYAWNPEKNQEIQERHNISFEQVAIAFRNHEVLDDFPHPGERYAHQRIAVVNINGYAIAVPYVENEDEIFFKTAFPNRKLQRKYFKS